MVTPGYSASAMFLSQHIMGGSSVPLSHTAATMKWSCAESGGMLGAKDEASADAAEMIAKARAAAKKDKAGPGVSVLHQVT